MEIAREFIAGWFAGKSSFFGHQSFRQGRRPARKLPEKVTAAPLEVRCIPAQKDLKV